MIILVLNCGSSSLKYQVLDMHTENQYQLLAKGLVERIGLEAGILSHRADGKDKYEVETPIPNHTVGIKKVLDILVDSKLGVLKSLSEINAVGHRVAHGGELFKKRESLLKPIQDDIYNAVKDISESKNIQLILDRASGNGIIFASPTIDISDEVLQKMGYSR